MITFFTTAKDFVGKNKITQINAIKSWQIAHPKAEVILFGDSQGAPALSQELNFIHIPEIQTSCQRTPFINDMFEKASKLASNEICCFINADIIVYSKFVQNLLDIHKLLKNNYLVVGQRQDINLEGEINFAANWETELNDLITKEGTIHPPTGSDFFGFPKSQYQQGDIPNLMVGRPGWDLWMIYNGRLKKFKVVDLSATTMVVHQNHDYSHRKVEVNSYEQDEEALSNYKNLPQREKYLYTLPACNYYYKNQKLKRNFARGDLKTFLNYEIRLRRNNPLVKFLLSRIENRAIKV